MWAFDWVDTAVLGDQHPIARLTGLRCNEWSLQWSAVGNPLLPASSFVLADGSARARGTPIQAATDDVIWTVLSQQCPGGRAPLPLVTGAIPRGTAPRYDLVANHAYSILGIERRGARRYVVLRNPWGFQPASGDAVASGVWQGLTLGDGGVFALDLTVFRTSFVSWTSSSPR